MTDLSRICPQCGKHFPLEARHCSHCGYDMDTTLPVAQNTLPALVGKAAAPLLVGAASLALSMGWKFLQGMLTRPARPANLPLQLRDAPPAPAQRRVKIHITTAWAVGDANGNWREGRSEQTIEIE